jgi:CzcA family heavy metal efflux pump
MQSHRSAVLWLLGLLAAGGLVSALVLPVALFPRIEFPRVLVNLDAGDRPADAMTIGVTVPVEEAIRSIPGIREIRSETSRGSCDVSINFAWGTDMYQATLQVASAINQAMTQLPAGTTFEVHKMDPTAFPSIAYSLTSDTQSLVKLRDAAYYQLRPLISTIPGVSHVLVQGGAEAEYHVVADPARLEAHGLTLADVSRALSASNTITAVGKLEDHDRLYLALGDTRITSADQIGATVLQRGPAGIVRVSDVATVKLDQAPQWIRVVADGHDAVLINVFQQPDANTVQIAKDVRDKLREAGPLLPPGIRIANWYDQSELILGAAKSVRDAVLIGICLAGVVLFTFLRNAKITFIGMVCVPAVLAATVLLLKVMNMSFNIMTRGGMAAAVGLIIDDAIVMVEHVVRRLRGEKAAGQHHGIVWSAAAEFTPPLVASSLSTIIIFAPLAFLSGVTGAFFKALSLTMAASLVISFLVAWLAVPILADHFLTEKDALQEEGGPFTAWLHRRYRGLMQAVLARPALVLLGVVPLVVGAFLAYGAVGSGFMPSMDEGGFILDFRTIPGTSLTESDRVLRQVEDVLKDTPEVDTYSLRLGAQLGAAGVTEPNRGDFFVRLKGFPRRPIDEVMDEVRTRVEKTVPGIDIELALLMEDLIGDLTAVPEPVEVKLYSDSEAALSRATAGAAAALGKVKGVVDVTNQTVIAGDAIDITVDRVKAALEGMDPDSVTAAIGDLLGGSVSENKVEADPKLIAIRAWIPASYRKTVDAIGDLRVRAPDGHFFPVRRVASITTVTGQPEIDRDDLKRMASVTGRISGRDLGSTIRDVKAALAAPGTIPAGVLTTLGGTYAQQQSAFAGLMAVFGAAVALVFLLQMFLYGRFPVAMAMLATTLLALTGVTIGLWLTNTELNISSMMGMTMIVGIAGEVAIFYVSELVDLRAEGNDREALIQAGVNRMRPILMTTIAAILALLPLALGLGAGSQMLQPLAIAIISGLLLQTPLVLITLPVLLSLVRPKR